MKKKFITVALSMVLCLSMGMTALAAPSPELSQTAQNLLAEPVDAGSSDILAHFGTGSTAQASLQQKLSGFVGGAVSNVTLGDAYDVTEGSAFVADGNKVQLPYKGATPDQDDWYIIHFDDNYNIKEVLKATVVENGLVRSIKSSNGYSPFAPARLTLASTNVTPGSNNTNPGPGASGQGVTNSNGGPGAPTESGSGSGSTAAPKTGDFATPIVAEVVALLSVAGIALYVKKSAAR